MNTGFMISSVRKHLVSGFCWLIANAAYAAEPALLTPVLRSGLWGMQTKTITQAVDAPMLKMCAGTQVQESNMVRKERKAVDQNCKILIQSNSTTKMMFTASCNFEGAKVGLEVESAGDFENTFTTTRIVDRNFPPPNVKTTEILYYRYISACPIGMTTGAVEIVEKGGVVTAKYNRYDDASASATPAKRKPIVPVAPPTTSNK